LKVKQELEFICAINYIIHLIHSIVDIIKMINVILQHIL